MYDTIIVGAGPSGSKTAEMLALAGKDVLVLEEDSTIGNPVQCTGIDSPRILPLSGAPEKIIMNKVNKARFYAQNGNYLELDANYIVRVFDRHRLDEEIAKRAKKAGAKIMTSTRFENFKRVNGHLEVGTTKGTFETKLLVGADGPNSTVAKLAGLKQPEEYVIGYQETIKHDFSDNIVELWFGHKITPDFFAWVVPEHKHWARVGLAAKKDSVKYLRSFVDRRFGKDLKKKDVLGGVIRYGLIKESVADNVLLVGDAASQVKAYSGGGIVYGLIGAGFAANASLQALKQNRFDYEFLKENYDKRWKQRLGSGIRRSLLLHRALHAVPDWLLGFSFTAAKPFRGILNHLDMDLLFD